MQSILCLSLILLAVVSGAQNAKAGETNSTGIPEECRVEVPPLSCLLIVNRDPTIGPIGGTINRAVPPEFRVHQFEDLAGRQSDFAQ
jgi:hypothetical protein